VQQWDYGNWDNQLFEIKPVGEYYRIIAKCSNKCLDIPSERVTENGAKVQQWDCNDVDNQLQDRAFRRLLSHHFQIQ
jgi:hypothetical protein